MMRPLILSVVWILAVRTAKSQRDWASANNNVTQPNNRNPLNDDYSYVLANGGAGSGYDVATPSDVFPFPSFPPIPVDVPQILDPLMIPDQSVPTSQPAPTGAVQSEHQEIVKFEECEDASVRGYNVPFACCTIKDGDFFDSSIWHCGRVPTMLDAAFIRHFVRLSDDNLAVETVGEVRLRALWIIGGGVLRSGKMPSGLCDKKMSQPPFVINAYLESFAQLLNGNYTLEALCEVLHNPLYPRDTDFEFKTDRPSFIRIEEISGPVPRNLALAVAMTGAIGYQKTDEATNSSAQQQPHVSSAEDHQRALLAMRRINPDLFRRANDNNNDNGFSAGGAPPPFLNPNNMNNTHNSTRRLQDYDNVQLEVPLKVSGDVVLRTDVKGAFVAFENTSVDVEGDIRNDGVLLIGEVISEECLKNENSLHGLCRIPSLVITGSMVAQEPMNIMWLQLSQSRASMTNPEMPPRKDVYYYGVVQYNAAFPDSYRSTLSVVGNFTVKRILPGFALSFKRIGFPPLNPGDDSAHYASINVLDATTSSLTIYVDVFDADGFIDCCKELHDKNVAQFDVRGTDLVFGRFSSFAKQLGDLVPEISDQLIIRAPRIVMAEAFAGTSNIIGEEDVELTNVMEPPKLAGLNRDIIYFQCSQICSITNQTFKNEEPYSFVQVKREPVK